MNTTYKNLPNDPSTGNPTANVKSSTGDEVDSSQNVAHCRADKNRLHALKHGILSRNLLEALVERGESLREWRDLIRTLRADLQVEGPLAELHFDRMCADMIREALISNAERAIFIAKDEGPEFNARLKRASMVAQFTKTTNVGDPQALDLLRYLPLIQRYRSQCGRDFNRELSAVLALTDGGPKALARFLSKTAARKRDTESDE